MADACRKPLTIERERWQRGMGEDGCQGDGLLEVVLIRLGLTKEEVEALYLAVEQAEDGGLTESAREEAVEKALADAGFAVTFVGEGAPDEIVDNLDWGACEECGAGLNPDGSCPDADSHDEEEEEEPDAFCRKCGVALPCPVHGQ